MTLDPLHWFYLFVFILAKKYKWQEIDPTQLSGDGANEKKQVAQKNKIDEAYAKEKLVQNYLTNHLPMTRKKLLL